MTEFRMPILGADMTAGRLVAWHKQPGDAVQKGDVVAEVETDKGLVEVEIFTAGTIERILVEPGAEVPVGTVLALVREEGEPAAALPPATRTPAESAPPRPAASPAPERSTPSPPEAGRARVSPLARKIAAELGVDLATVHGTGPGRAISREDVERAAAGRAGPVAAPVATAGAAATDRAERMREAIATAMARSKREIPHYYLATTIDLHRALAWLAERNRDRPIAERLLPGVLLIKAVALALRAAPELNAWWVAGRAVPSAAIHVGVAVALRGGGVVAPALHDADRRSLDELMRDLRDLVGRARTGSFRSSEISDPTITVTSLGDQGVETVFPIIYPPQVAIVGFGKVVDRPWAAAGEVVVRPLVTATLAADHRVSDGHRGGLFLAAVDRLLQAPEAL